MLAYKYADDQPDHPPKHRFAPIGIAHIGIHP
jgi:hypothetical protein